MKRRGSGAHNEYTEQRYIRLFASHKQIVHFGGRSEVCIRHVRCRLFFWFAFFENTWLAAIRCQKYGTHSNEGSHQNRLPTHMPIASGTNASRLYSNCRHKSHAVARHSSFIKVAQWKLWNDCGKREIFAKPAMSRTICTQLHCADAAATCGETFLTDRPSKSQSNIISNNNLILNSFGMQMNFARALRRMGLWNCCLHICLFVLHQRLEVRTHFAVTLLSNRRDAVPATWVNAQFVLAPLPVRLWKTSVETHDFDENGLMHAAHVTRLFTRASTTSFLIDFSAPVTRAIIILFN